MKDPKQLVTLGGTVWEKDRGIVFLTDQFGVGADIKFKEDAYVIVISEQAPTKELLIQKLGRGSRACGDYRGRLFVIGAPNLKASVEKRIKQSSEPDFYYGAKWIIDLIQSGTPENADIAEALCSNAKGKWCDKEANLEKGLIAKWSKKLHEYQKKKKVAHAATN